MSDAEAAIPQTKLEAIQSGVPFNFSAPNRRFRHHLPQQEISEDESLLRDSDHRTSSSEDDDLSWSFRRSERSTDSKFTASIQKGGKSLKQYKEFQDLKINKLKYEAIDVVGRGKEINTLRNSVVPFVSQTQECRTPKSKELIMIKGYSGIGKSRLVDSVVSLISEYPTGISKRGKYARHAFDQPYTGIVSAFRSLINAVKNKETHIKEEGAKAIGKEVLKELGSSIHLLVNLIPELLDITELSSLDEASVNLETLRSSNYFQRIQYSFRILARVLCSYFKFVMVLDDLQWADAASLRTIDFLLSDAQNTSGLIIIGLYRSNEVGISHGLTRMMNDLERKKEIFGFKITQLELQTLQVEDINKIIMAMLSVDDESRTIGLANICARRTLGNPFFVIEFITNLELEGLLCYNLGLLKWVWVEGTIENETMSSSNVVDLLQARMEKMSESLQLLLQFAACLASPFKTFALDLIWERLGVFHGEMATDVDILLRPLISENFIETAEEGSFRWVHEKVQEAALALGSASDESFQFDIGLTLYNGLSEGMIDEVLFDIVNLLNKGRSSERRRLEFVNLNLKAALKARSRSWFQNAASYVKAGIEQLPDDMWTSHRELTLNLFSLGAEMEGALGNDNAMQEYIEEVLSQDDVSSMEKLPVYLAKSHKLCNVDLLHQETVDFCLDILTELGCPLTSGVVPLPAKATYTLIKTVKTAKARALDSYKSPKEMTDKKLRSVMLVLSRVFYASYFTSTQWLLVLSACKMVNLTLKHGASPLSGQAYASLGMIVISVMGDYKTSTEFAKIGLLIQKAFQSKHTECQTLFYCTIYILCWTTSLQSCMKSLESAHSLGMRSGNIENAMWSLNAYHAFYPYAMGKKLATLEAPCERIISQMLDLRQNDQAINTRKWWQLFLNLMGDCDDVMMLKGAAFDAEDFVPTVPNHLPIVRHLESELYLFYGDYKRAADSALARANDFEKIFTSHAIVMIECFHRGVALYAMARKSKSRKYKIGAAKIRKTVKRWSQNGNPNVKHYNSFLSAERAALTGDFDNAEVQYKESIKRAARTGHLHHAGLFNERYADFLKCERDDLEESNYHISEAIRWYGEWGATAKVEMLQKSLEK